MLYINYLVVTIDCQINVTLLGQNKEVHGQSERGNRKERRSVPHL